MRTLVIGYGSIGSRHARILQEMGCSVAIVSGRDVSFSTRFESVSEAIREFVPEYAVIATETARHISGIASLTDAGFSGTLLVEKPLFHIMCDLPTVFSGAFVAYNLRFHPLSQRLRTLLIPEKVLSVQAYVGQYLPTWRPGRDYRKVYSSVKQAGGGVLRDLSHELDLLNWLLGGWQKLTAVGGHFGHLEIDSDDVFSIMMTTERCPVATVQLNYYDRIGQRRILVNTDKFTIEADFNTGRLLINGAVEEYKVERDHTYREMHRALLDGSYLDVCSLAEGVDVMHMIAAAEQAAGEVRWIVR